MKSMFYQSGNYDIIKENVMEDKYMKNNYTEISKEEARNLYCKGDNIYICNKRRKYWKLPASYQYSSHAPVTELFERSIPKYEGDTKFYKL